jgi:hypothetical protein
MKRWHLPYKKSKRDHPISSAPLETTPLATEEPIAGGNEKNSPQALTTAHYLRRTVHRRPRSSDIETCAAPPF